MAFFASKTRAHQHSVSAKLFAKFATLILLIAILRVGATKSVLPQYSLPASEKPSKQTSPNEVNPHTKSSSLHSVVIGQRIPLCFSRLDALLKMNWLHLSDFHVGDSRGAQENAFLTLADTIKSECARMQFRVDLVILAGDLAFSGNTEEYQIFKKNLLDPLRAIPELSKARFLAVPGNHDVDCANIYPMLWNEFPQKKKDAFFCENKDGASLRQGKAIAFDAYSRFVSNEKLLGPNPNKEVTWVYADDTLPVSVVATNTAYFSDENEHRRLKSTPFPFASVRRIFADLPAAKPILLIGHHSPDSFFDADKKAFRSLLIDKKAVYIHGHEHDPSSNFTADGTLLTLGFGASYTTSLETKTVSRYRNSFAFCSLSQRLSIRSFVWDCDIGRWVEATSTQFNECKDDTHPQFGSCKSAGIPSIAPDRYASTPVPIGTLPRATARPSRILPVGQPGMKIWQHLFIISEFIGPLLSTGGFKVVDLPSPEGKLEMSIESEDERHLVVCIPGINHVLSQKEAETLNTRLDTEDFATATILSLGRLSDDARTIYLRLKRTKSIEVLANADLTECFNSILSRQQIDALQKLDPALANSQVLVSEHAVSCLIVEGQEPRSSFYVLNEAGQLMNEADALIAAIRAGSPEFSKIPYKGSAAQVSLAMPVFSVEGYLAQCYKEYNSTKYAALANVGLRFSDLPLSELYVDATAREVAGQGTSKVASIVEDHLAGMPVTDALKAHIQKNLLDSLDGDTSQETSDAREFCQKYAATLVTGDPGAGKTCFVKNEILAYCARAVQNARRSSDWHASHAPVMIQLSEAVGEPDLAEIGFLGVASRLLARRAISAPTEWLREMASQGRLALFFDGLDEVVSIEKRALAVRLINEFSQAYLASGNRIVVTSRPAAVQVVNLLPTFHRLELQGLNEANIRLLAHRILSLKLADTIEGTVIDQRTSNNGESVLLEKLMEDCRDNPGVGRLAQNPLLLTLLILIYANSGAPSAKRHSIYEQAIRTLSSVRRIEAGHVPISTQDLRERLGAVALSVYRNESGLLPTRGKVADIIRSVMTQQRGEEVALSDADDFIQKVAESTGLISIGKRRTDTDDAIITFMHHSFLEYFAAIGVSLQLDEIKIEELVHKPRWREILTLLAGIIGENADIAPYLNRFIHAIDDASDVDSKVVSFAMDCALECDVASETSQRLLTKVLKSIIRSGPPRVDPWVRAEIAERLDALIQSCGAAHFESMFLSIFQNSVEEDEIGAAIRTCAGAFASVPPPASILTAIDKLAERSSESIETAICWAAGENPHFRTDRAIALISENLRKSRRRRHTAYESLARMPNQAAQHWPELIAGIDEDDLLVKRSASVAAIQAGLNADLIALSGSKKDVLVRALRYADELASSRNAKRTRVRHETLERLLDSGEKRSRLVGIALLPMGDFAERDIYDQLVTIVKTREDREEIVAAFTALRHAGSALVLMTQVDLKWIFQWIEKGTADVRSEGMRLLGLFGQDVTVNNFLRTRKTADMDADEFAVFAAALARTKVQKPDAAAILAVEVLNMTGTDMSFGRDNLKRLAATLDGLRRLEQNVDDKTAARIRGIAEDFRAPDSLRGASLSTLPAVTAPTPRLIAFLCEAIRLDSSKLERDLVQVPSVLARKCRQEVDYVLACVRDLPELKAAATALYKSIAARPVTTEIEFRAGELRTGVNELGEIIAAFNEYLAKPNAT